MKVGSDNRKMAEKKMKRFGKYLAALMLATSLLWVQFSHAAVIASVDRDRVAMGDTLRLVISATDNEAINNSNLRPILKDFEILQRSTSSSTSIINGQRTQSREILLDITPRREGTLRIPSLRVGNKQTNFLLISVGPAPTSATGGQTVIFEAELDRTEIYVQGQVILTLRVLQAINLDSRSVTELHLDDAFVKQLEQKSFQRTVDGRPWLVHEIRYAIFPEKSGTLSIPSQTFAARESAPRRGIFDRNNGRRLSRESRELTIDVLPKPATFPSSTWLPARQLNIEEQWSTAPENLRVGESATRTIRITGEGLQGAQLPPVLFKPIEGLKYYPDQPTIEDNEVSTGLEGARVDSAAMVPTLEGNYQIPEIRIPWWDTEAGVVRYATLPAREIRVAAGDPSSMPPAVPIASGELQVIAANKPFLSIGGDALWWQLATAFSTTAWLLSLWYIFARRRRAPAEPQQESNGNEPQAYKLLMAACATNKGGHVRKAFIDWCCTLFPARQITTLELALNVLQNEEVKAQFEALNRALYSDSARDWDGADLATRLKALRALHKKSANKTEPALQLYPAGT